MKLKCNKYKVQCKPQIKVNMKLKLPQLSKTFAWKYFIT